MTSLFWLEPGKDENCQKLQAPPLPNRVRPPAKTLTVSKAIADRTLINPRWSETTYDLMRRAASHST